MQEEVNLEAANARLKQMGFAGGTEQAPEPPKAGSEHSAGRITAPPVTSGAGVTRHRKQRSDKGKTKPPKLAEDEIVLRLTLDQARNVALGSLTAELPGLIQDQIIAQLQKRIDQLTKQK